jgi:glutamine synthetase
MGQRDDRPRDASVSEDPLVAFVCCDLGAIVRGRSLFASELDAHLRSGVGWVPANHALTPLGPLAEPNPFGSLGDLRLLPDPGTRARVYSGEGPPFDVMLCDIVETDGQPWRCCPRRLLRDALATMEHALGAHVVASFEHEFQLLLDAPASLPFTLQEQREVEPFASEVMVALAEAGLEPERIFAEYSPHQFEIPLAPAHALASADRAVLLREIVRDVARRSGKRASFAPLLDPEQAGNGVHVHLSIVDAAGESLLYDRRRPACLSELGGRFAAGILEHAAALSALTAPSPVSAARLQPHRWSAGSVCLARQSREALLRIPPLLPLAGDDPAAQLHLEYRGADASANPHLALAAILLAGLEGVRGELSPAPVLESDPALLDGAEARRLGVGALPGSLGEALDALAQDAAARAWLDPLLYDAYTAVKRAELDASAELDLGERCRRYARIY